MQYQYKGENPINIRLDSYSTEDRKVVPNEIVETERSAEFMMKRGFEVYKEVKETKKSTKK